jgi:hypothetical protein
VNAVHALPDARLGDGALARAFRERGAATYREAADLVWRLAYGRTSDRARPEAVLEEGRGTCSSKHALLAQLAREQGLAVELVLGIYLMDGENTPGIGGALREHGLDAVPEAHCVLRVGGRTVDLTHPPEVPAGPEVRFVEEEIIAPEQVGEYKVRRHRDYIERWPDRPSGMTADGVWAAREACIAALSDA